MTPVSSPRRSILVMYEKDGEVVPFRPATYATLQGAMENNCADQSTLVERRPGLWTALAKTSGYMTINQRKTLDRLKQPVMLYFVDVYEYVKSVVEPEIQRK